MEYAVQAWSPYMVNLDIQVLEKVQQRATKCHWFEEQDLPTETEDYGYSFFGTSA